MMDHKDLIDRLEELAHDATRVEPRETRLALMNLTARLQGNHGHMGGRHYDLARREWVDRPLPCGMQTAISWTRLVDELRRSGEFRADERVAHIEVSARGISFHIETD